MANLLLMCGCIFMIPVRFRDKLPDLEMVDGGYTVSDTCVAFHRAASLQQAHGGHMSIRKKGRGSGPGAFSLLYWRLVWDWRMTWDSGMGWEI